MPPQPAFRLDEFVQAEVDLQAAGADAFNKLLRPPAQWSAFPAGHIELTGQQAARLARIGMKPNWPDHLILFPGENGPVLIGIEWKTGDGRLSISRVVHSRRTGKARWIEGQREAFPKLRAAGMKIFVCVSVEHALKILQASGCPMVKWEMTA